MTPPLLDTHAWVWWIDQDARLGGRTIDALDGLAREERPFLSDISLWEVAMLVERGRLELDIPVGEWLEAATRVRCALFRFLPMLPPRLPSSRSRFIAIQPIA